MPLYSEAIPNLFNGISQQAAALRLPSQAELQENAYSSIVDGLTKRPPSVHNGVTGLGASPGKATVHLMNYSATEQFILVLRNGSVKVFDLSGAEKTVTTPDGVSYLTTSNADKDFSLVTVADYTFIVNKTLTAAMDSAVGSTGTPTGFIWIKVGVTDTNYNVTFGGNTVTHTSAASGTIKTDLVAEDLKDKINATSPGTWAASRKGSVIKIQRVDTTDFTLSGSDSFGDQGLKAIKGEVQKFSDLPAIFWENVVIKVVGISDEKNQFDNLHVKWVEGNTTGTWIETVKEGLQNQFDATTMPHTLVKNIDGTFTFAKAAWDARTVGDEVVTPEPSFIGTEFNDVFFYKNRLGFLADESVILSRSGDYFNFWPETASTVLDSDPIDISASNKKISILQHAVPFDENLLVFSNQSQFSLNHDDILSPTSVSLDVTTEYESSLDSKPIGAGTNLFFAVNRGSYTGVREYYVSSELVSNDAVDITSHIPSYVPSNVRLLTASSNEDVLLAVSENEKDAIYVYKYYWNENREKIQSAWFKWKFDAGDSIIGLGIIDTEIIIITERSDDVYIDKIDVQSNQSEVGMPFVIHLDRKVELTGVYDSGLDKTTWTLPYAYSGDVEVALSSGFTGKAGKYITVTRPTTTTVEATGDYSASTAFIGVPYIMKYQFSEQFLKDANGNAHISPAIQMRNMFLSYLNSGYFKVQVTHKAGNTYETLFTGKVIGSSEMVIGEPQINSGVISAPIYGDSRTVTITLLNDTYLPSQFQSAEWEAFINSRSFRRGNA